MRRTHLSDRVFVAILAALLSIFAAAPATATTVSATPVSATRVAATTVSATAVAATADPELTSAKEQFGAISPAMDLRIRGKGYVPNELLIKFREPATRGGMERASREEGARLVDIVTTDGLAKIRLGAGATVDGEIARWIRRGDVEYAVPNIYAQAFFTPNDSVIATFDLAWNLRAVGAYAAWDVVTGDPSVVLAIVDTGVAFEDQPIPDYELHFVKPGVTMYRQSPELPGPFLPGWDFVNDDSHPNDDSGHGTSVTTIAAGAANNLAGSAGIAFGVTILPVKVINFDNNAQTDHIIKGIRFAADQGADVINLSLGYPSISSLLAFGYTKAELNQMFRPLRDAVSYAQGRGAIVVAAAGNFDYPELGPPAVFPGVIAVGATGVDNRRSSYSSYGRALDVMAPGGDFTELNGDHIQDGVAVLSIKPRRSEGSLANPDSFNVFYFFGTSGASPHVAGAVALLMSEGLHDRGEIQHILRSTALNPINHRARFDLEYGYGLIRIDRAVRKARRHEREEEDGDHKRDHIHSTLLSGNPSTGDAAIAFTLAAKGTVTATVFDVRGRLVRSLVSTVSPAGPSTLRWDGKDGRGAPVPSGIYFFRVATPEGSATHKVAFLR